MQWSIYNINLYKLNTLLKRKYTKILGHTTLCGSKYSNSNSITADL